MNKWLLMRITLLIPAEKPAQDGLLVLDGLQLGEPGLLAGFRGGFYTGQTENQLGQAERLL